MYHSRLHFASDQISIAIDTKNGSILELVNLSTGDNLIKNHRHSLGNTFELISADGKKLSIPSAEAIYKNPDLGATFKEGRNSVRVNFNLLTDGTDIFNISLEYKIMLDDNKIKWNISFVNNSELRIVCCKYPYICGVWLGESYEDDTLVYPFNAGIKIENPTEYLSMSPMQIGWRWQDYKYTYNVDGLGLYPDKNGYYALSSKYSGPLSMAWCDLYDKKGGIYFASHSKGQGIISIRCEAMGAKSAGINFAVAKDININKSETFFYNSAVTVLHNGDWHEGSDLYRNYFGDTKANMPEWFAKNSGLYAHYDFKYQNGGVVHNFTDIPSLADQAAETGLKHLLFAGWHRDGFDHGFPMYVADEDCGTAEELKAGIEYAHSKGARVSFYINSRIANRKYSELAELIADNAIVKSKKENGEVEIASECYGNLDLNFAVMCANAKGWQDKIASAFDYVRAVGADGVYFDQIAMAPPCVCLNETHGHAPDDWNSGCKKLIELANERNLTVIIEGCSDLYGGMVAGQLVSTFSYIACAFPELYKYTFPNQVLVDMVYPKRGMAMRPTFVGDRWKQLIDTTFVCGGYFWAYDLIDDNTFTKDSVAYEYLKKVVKLRRLWLEKYGHMLFCDEKGISLRGNIKAKSYDDGKLISVACDENSEIVFDRNICIDEVYSTIGNPDEITANEHVIKVPSEFTGIIKLK